MLAALVTATTARILLILDVGVIRVDVLKGVVFEE
jgi:hypothetical protein